MDRKNAWNSIVPRMRSSCSFCASRSIITSSFMSIAAGSNICPTSGFDIIPSVSFLCLISTASISPMISCRGIPVVWFRMSSPVSGMYTMFTHFTSKSFIFWNRARHASFVLGCCCSVICFTSRTHQVPWQSQCCQFGESYKPCLWPIVLPSLPPALVRRLRWRFQSLRCRRQRMRCRGLRCVRRAV